MSGKTQLPSSVLKDGLHLQLCSASQFLFLIQKHSSPGSGQDRVYFFAVARRGCGQDTEVVLHYLTTLLGTRKWGSSSHITRLCMVSSHLWAIPFCAHSKYCCCHCPFSYFIVVPSRFFFHQLPTFTFCASNSPLQPPAEEGWGVSERYMVWSVLVGTINWGILFLSYDSNPSKFQQYTASFISHFPGVCLHPLHTSSCSSSLREYSSQGSNSPGNMCFTKWTCVAA